jgi:hypothetical protein
MNISAKFGPNLFSGFREQDENMKCLQMQTMDTKWWQKLTWPGELKTDSTKSAKLLINLILSFDIYINYYTNSKRTADQSQR